MSKGLAPKANYHWDGTNWAKNTPPATEAKQDDSNTKLDTLNAQVSTESKQEAILTELEKKADLTETQPVSVSSFPLPTGSATEAKQDDIISNQTNGSQQTQILPSDSAIMDAFGRLRVSNPTTLFDSKQIYDDPDLASSVENQPLFYDNQETSGTGTSTAFNVDTASTTLTVSDATAGTRIRQTRMRFNYQPGKSIQVLMTFKFPTKEAGITVREGQFDDDNGLFLEQTGTTVNLVRRTYVTGSAVDNKVAQADWNLDKMDGTGASGETLDLTKTQILFLDYEWLGVGRVRMGFVIGGIIHYVHEFLNANTLTEVYMSTPNLPLRSEISNDGNGGEASLVQICSTVISEGGLNELGTIRYASTQGTAVTCTTENTLYAILGIRLKAGYLSESVNILNKALQIQSATDRIEWVLLFNPTVAGTFSYVGESQSGIEVARGASANTVTGGYKVTGGFLESGGQQAGSAGSGSLGIENAILLGSLIDGTPDQFVLCARPIGGSSGVEVEGSITWRELS